MSRGLILIGGKSLRMGEDKFLIETDGTPQYIRLAELAAEAGLAPYISCNQSQGDFLSQNYPVIVDKYEGYGPMGGIVSAFTEYPDSSWLVIACDLFELDLRAITDLLEADEESYDVICYQKSSESFYETTCAIYHPSSLKPLSNLVKQGKLSLQKALNELRVKTIAPYDPRVLKNVNTPDDLK